ncbi:MAG TPA: hypothetical protein H9935_12800 [Candidatus Blautia merdigallinarum]|uniref:Uncharacterized protein n=1 Tax=Candidatus Blautia merdigallinarum TaxID=2838495 RepID=A0A9D2SLK0_9FIRM|nr:hypothetical protein [Candidatus Blautia merdigallinarum]
MVREVEENELNELLKLYLHEDSLPEMTEHLKDTWTSIVKELLDLLKPHLDTLWGTISQIMGDLNDEKDVNYNRAFDGIAHRLWKNSHYQNI